MESTGGGACTEEDSAQAIGVKKRASGLYNIDSDMFEATLYGDVVSDAFKSERLASKAQAWLDRMVKPTFVHTADMGYVGNAKTAEILRRAGITRDPENPEEFKEQASRATVARMRRLENLEQEMAEQAKRLEQEENERFRKASSDLERVINRVQACGADTRRASQPITPTSPGTTPRSSLIRSHGAFPLPFDFLGWRNTRPKPLIGSLPDATPPRAAHDAPHRLPGPAPAPPRRATSPDRRGAVANAEEPTRQSSGAAAVAETEDGARERRSGEGSSDADARASTGMQRTRRGTFGRCDTTYAVSHGASDLDGTRELYRALLAMLVGRAGDSALRVRAGRKGEQARRALQQVMQKKVPKTSYEDFNEHAVDPETEREYGARERFVRWLMERRAYYGDILSRTKAEELYALLRTLTLDEREGVLQAFRDLSAAVRPDAFHSETKLKFHAPGVGFNDHELNELTRKKMRGNFRRLERAAPTDKASTAPSQPDWHPAGSEGGEGGGLRDSLRASQRARQPRKHRAERKTIDIRTLAAPDNEMRSSYEETFGQAFVRLMRVKADREEMPPIHGIRTLGSTSALYGAANETLEGIARARRQFTSTRAKKAPLLATPPSLARRPSGAVAQEEADMPPARSAGSPGREAGETGKQRAVRRPKRSESEAEAGPPRRTLGSSFAARYQATLAALPERQEETALERGKKAIAEAESYLQRCEGGVAAQTGSSALLGSTQRRRKGAAADVEARIRAMMTRGAAPGPAASDAVT
ncbi:unnamed protein product [Pedinophyceae sp. YPF-701]|nr:unnamed protein product [Pedinophyceae sp. YPF-701]